MNRYPTVSAVARAFVTHAAPSGRASSLSFEGNVAYSYRTPVARLYPNPHGNVLFLSCINYSRTTQSHISLIERHAVGHNPHIREVYVADVLCPGSHKSIGELLGRIAEQHEDALNTRRRLRDRLASLGAVQRLASWLAYLVEEYHPQWTPESSAQAEEVQLTLRVLHRRENVSSTFPRFTQPDLDALLRLEGIAALELSH